MHSEQDGRLLRLVEPYKDSLILGMGYCGKGSDAFVLCSREQIFGTGAEKSERKGYALRRTISSGKLLGAIQFSSTPVAIEASPTNPNQSLVLLRDGSLYLWTFDAKHNGLADEAAATAACKATTRRVLSKKGLCRIRWHPKARGASATRVALGFEDGRVGLLDMTRMKSSEFCRPADRRDRTPVKDLRWDPLSTDYLIVVQTDSVLRLVDVSAKTQVTRFDIGSGGPPTMAAFLHNIPGGVVTISPGSRFITEWNVSRKAPVRKHLVPASSRGLRSIKPLSVSGRYFLTMTDGSVGVFNWATKSLLFRTGSFHSETVFGCAFAPGDASRLATCSFDGTVKVWNADHMKCEATNDISRVTIYALSWNPKPPAGASQIACGNFRGRVKAFDPVSGAKVTEFSSGRFKCLGVAWSPDGKVIAATNTDGTLGIYSPAGKTLAKSKLGESMWDVSWSPLEPSLLAAAGANGLVLTARFDGASLRDINMRKPRSPGDPGHKKRVFTTKWSPLIPQVFASGSDDTTVCVWDMQGRLGGGGSGSDAPFKVLRGHKNFVRGLSWHTELPNILLSGAWEGEVRVWNVASGSCLYTCTNHHADVYGIASHPSSPFSFTTCSRDTTLRQFMTDRMLAPGLALEFVAAGGDPSALKISLDAVAEFSADATSPRRLCGEASRALVARLKRLGKVERYAAFFAFARPSPGSKDLWDIVLSAKVGKKCPTTNRVLRVADAVEATVSEADALCAVTGFTAPGTLPKEQRLQKAAMLYLRTGRVKQYCETMIMLGFYDKALAAAPLVSLQYWRELSRKRAAEVAGSASDDQEACLACAGDIGQLIELHAARGRLDQALLAAATLNSEPGDAKNTRGDSKSSTVQSEEARGVARRRANAFLAQSEILLAAASLLSVDDVAGAVGVLRRGDEDELALAVCDCYDATPPDALLRSLARRCSLMGLATPAVRLISRLGSPDVAARARAVGSGIVRTAQDSQAALRKEAKARSADSYRRAAKDAGADDGLAASYLLAAGDAASAVKRALSCLGGVLSQPKWTLERARPALEVLQAVPLEEMTDAQRNETLFLSARVGAREAGERGFREAEAFLRTSAKMFADQTGAKLPSAEGSGTVAGDSKKKDRLIPVGSLVGTTDTCSLVDYVNRTDGSQVSRADAAMLAAVYPYPVSMAIPRRGPSRK